ncbi:heme A synthase [Sinomicrobium pectinilyticum]|uniref:Heme A synthase n=1 Tax=Sinomicrobium pectinilyticum TaxID=1084421 RepID=A0A3N0DHP9_SINP1|nr:COX15/CtaA family protein [Sinomicrobium pectinilyticum]RNL75207.1 heme A synthase [Sinomicrobium pectinilyticum]
MRVWLKKNFRTITKTTLILVYLVIIAGALVRMTGSGMGCPDWPKCFGYYIPPTEESQLLWHPDRAYKKGQVIIRDESLLVAKADFTTSGSYSSGNWAPYTKHDYAVFNPRHTWIEYINRLCGAVAGMATLFMAVASFVYWKEKRSITLLSWLAVFSMGFQAWLGATVVYSVLAPVKITVHMVMALAIVALILYILHLTRTGKSEYKPDRLFTNLIRLALFLTLIQIVLGTQVRQFVDEQVKIVGDTAKDLWLNNPGLDFYLHRSFSILVLAVNIFLFILNRNRKLYFTRVNWVLLLIALEIISGVAMAYLDFPFASQPLHLVLASVLFGVQYYLLLDTRHAAKSL